MYNYEYIKIIIGEFKKLSRREQDILMRMTDRTESPDKIATEYNIARQQVYQIKEEAEAKIARALLREKEHEGKE